MYSERQRELYAQFEADANEVVFGQRTAPDRPLTGKEVSVRKNIILKLVDQKLKFELIDLMRRQQPDASSASSLSTSTIAPLESTRPSQPIESSIRNEAETDSTVRLTNMSPLGVRVPVVTSPEKVLTTGANPLLSATSNRSHGDWCAISKTHEESTHNERAEQRENAFLSDSEDISAITEEGQSSSAIEASGSSSRKTIKRKPEECFSDEFQKKMLIINEEIAANATNEKSSTSVYVETNEAPLNTSQADSFVDLTLDEMIEEQLVAISVQHESMEWNATTVDFGTNETAQSFADFTMDEMIDEYRVAKSAPKESSAEWNALDQLVTDLFRNPLGNGGQLTPSERQLKNEVLIQISIDPAELLLHANAQKVRRKVDPHHFDAFINACKAILANLRLTGPENLAHFSESQKKLVAELREQHRRHEAVKPAPNYHAIHTKIEHLISPFLCPGVMYQSLIMKLIRNPYELQNNAIIRNEIAAMGQSIDDVMKSIKCALDQYVPARLPKKFRILSGRFIDVPFVVNLYDRSVKLNEDSATELANVLRNSINCLKIDPKPAIRAIQFDDGSGSLKVLCLNSMSFDWLTNTISGHLGVDSCPVSNAIPMNQLKTVRLVFERPQYLHFNFLMDQLKADNPRLLTRRWELRSPRFVDSTKWMDVGVDVDSLIVLEEMDRIGTFRDTTISFEISYAENQENFEKMTRVKKTNFMKKKKKQRRYKR